MHTQDAFRVQNAAHAQRIPQLHGGGCHRGCWVAAVVGVADAAAAVIGSVTLMDGVYDAALVNDDAIFKESEDALRGENVLVPELGRVSDAGQES